MMAPGGGGQIPQGYQQSQTGPGQQQQYTTAAPTAGYQQAPPNAAPVGGGSMYNPYNMHGECGLRRHVILGLLLLILFSTVPICVTYDRVVPHGHSLIVREQFSFFPVLEL